MKIYALTKGETQAGQDGFFVDGIDPLFPFYKFLSDSDPAPDSSDTFSYTDITSIDTLARQGLEAVGLPVVRDKLVLSSLIEAAVVLVAGADYSSWNKLSDNQKIIACNWIPTKIPLARFAATIAAQDREGVVRSYISLSQEAWSARMDKAEVLIFTSMPAAARHQLLKDIFILRGIYLKGGVTTLADTGASGIVDFLASTGDYSDAGFVEKAYTVNVGQTLSGISTTAINILNGIY